MNKPFKFLWIGILFSFCTNLPTNDCCQYDCHGNVKTAFVPISQGVNLYTQYHKVAPYNPDSDCSSCFDFCNWNFDLSATYRFQQTRNGCCDIANMLFGNCNLLFQGSNIDNRDEFALVAENFGMGSDTDASLCLSPRIRNNILDLQLAVNSDKLYFQVNVPITYSQWKLNSDCCDNDRALGTYNVEDSGEFWLRVPDMPNATAVNLEFGSSEDNIGAGSAGDFDAACDESLDVTNYLEDFIPSGGATDENFLQVGFYSVPTCSAMDNVTDRLQTVVYANSGTTDLPEQTESFTEETIYSAKSFREALGGYTFGNLANRHYDLFKLDDDCKSKWKVADVILQLGYDFYKCEDRHFGLYLKALIPTGTNLERGWKHHNFNPIIGNGHHFELGGGISAHMDFCVCDDSMFTLNVDGYLTHMFKKKQFRTFDVCGLPMSRYSLFKEMTPYDHNGDEDINENGFAYTGRLVAGADVNNACVDVSIDVRGEALIDLIYTCCNWELGGGYAFSGQSKEKICDSCCVNKDSYYYGFKGNTGEAVMLFVGQGAASSSGNLQMNHTGTNGFLTIDYTLSPFVVSNRAGSAYNYGDDYVIAGEEDLLQLSDVNRSGLMEGQILHRLFGHIDYVWADCCWQPEIGILGSFGWTQDCYRTAEYWDLGARLGFSF